MNKTHLLAKSGILLLGLYAFCEALSLAKLDLILVRPDFEHTFSSVSAGLLLAIAIIVLFESDALAYRLAGRPLESNINGDLLPAAFFRLPCFFLGAVVSINSLWALRFIYDYYFDIGLRASLMPTASEALRLVELGIGIYLLLGARYFVSWQIKRTREFFAGSPWESKETYNE